MASYLKDKLGFKKKKKNKPPSYGESSSYSPSAGHPGVYPVSYNVGLRNGPPSVHHLHLDPASQGATGSTPTYPLVTHSYPPAGYVQHIGYQEQAQSHLPFQFTHPTVSYPHHPTDPINAMGGCLSSPKPEPNHGPPQPIVLNGLGVQQNPFVSPDQIAPHINEPSSPGVGTPANGGGIIVRAVYDFQARVDDDLTFKKGDKMVVIGDSENCDWWMARHHATGQVGYIPSNYVSKDDNNPESQEWWFSVDRREADKQLMSHSNTKGTFLIRASSDKKCYALSILDYNETTKEHGIKHYRVRTMDDGGCYISAKRTFRNLLELIAHYKTKSDGLCTMLTKACPKEPEPVPFKDIEVERSQLRLDKKLGAGNFGEVFSGKWRGHVDVAVKTLKHGSMSPEAFLEEAKIMHKLRHRKLVQLMGVCTLEEPMYIITELMVNGSLLEYLRMDEGKTLKLPGIIDMSAQVANGMEYLEAKNYVHRDLRAANILVGENNVVKVADFGLARFTESDAVYLAHEATKFPIKWTAPEAAFERKFSVKSDVWSYGILLYELITYGRIPYPGMPGAEVLQRLEQGYRMPNPTSDRFTCPQSIYDTMCTCWHRVPERRPTFAYLYNFFDDYFVSTEGSYREPI